MTYLFLCEILMLSQNGATFVKKQVQMGWDRDKIDVFCCCKIAAIDVGNSMAKTLKIRLLLW